MRPSLALTLALLVGCDAVTEKHQSPDDTHDGDGNGMGAAAGSSATGEDGNHGGASPRHDDSTTTSASGGALYHTTKAGGTGGTSEGAGEDESGGTDDGSGANPGSGGAETGSGGSSNPLAHGCVHYEDRSAESAKRTILWNFDLPAERCMIVRVGQRVTWSGNFEWHPLRSFDPFPSPITDSDPSAELHTVQFGQQGVFSYICDQHTEMRGAIRVEP